MKKDDVKAFALLNGSPIAREPKLAKGRYLLRKLNSIYRIVAEVKDKVWKQVEDTKTKCLRYMIFVTVENTKTKAPCQISVPVGFLDFPEKGLFYADVDDNGYITVSLTKVTEKQAEKLTAETIS